MLEAALVKSAAEALEHVAVLTLNNSIRRWTIVGGCVMQPSERLGGLNDLAAVVRVQQADLRGASEVPQGHFGDLGVLGGARARLEPCRRPVIDGQQVPLRVVTLISSREHDVVGREHISESLRPF